MEGKYPVQQVINLLVRNLGSFLLVGYTPTMTCNAFVLGGGGVLGAAEVGMARALLEAGVRPELICGTSVGAINGAALAGRSHP